MVISPITYVVDGSDEEEHLGPAKSRDGVDGSNTVGHISELEARGDLTREAEDFRDDVTNDSKLSNASVLQFRLTVLVKCGLVNVAGQTERIEETSGSNDTELVFVRHFQGGGGLAALGSEGSGRAGKEGSDGEFHF